MSNKWELPRLITDFDNDGKGALDIDNAYSLMERATGGAKFIAVCVQQDETRHLVAYLFHPERPHIGEVGLLKENLEKSGCSDFLLLGAGMVQLGSKQYPIRYDSDTLRGSESYGYDSPSGAKFPLESSEQGQLVQELQLLNDPIQLRELGYGDHASLEQAGDESLGLSNALLMTILIEVARSIADEGDYFDIGLDNRANRAVLIPSNGYVYDQQTGKRTYYDSLEERRAIHAKYS